MQQVQLTPVEQVRMVVIVDNYYDGLLPGSRFVQRYGFVQGDGPVVSLPQPLKAEHGFACYVEISGSATGRQALLYDFGLTQAVYWHNLQALDLDPFDIGALVLSHGHFDHFGGLYRQVEFLSAAGQKGLPLYVGCDTFKRRYINLPGRLVDLGQLEKERLLSGGVELLELAQSREILPGIGVIAAVPRVTDFETGSPLLGVESESGVEQDNFPGELSLAFHVQGKGLVIISACAHAGIANIILHAQEVFGLKDVYAVLGGWHLSGAPETRIKQTADFLAGLNPHLVVPMHCSGFAALSLFARQFGEAMALYSVGTEYKIY
ncbi:MAG: MBL fold metallo-hydrolase [Bacillota bacterium]